MTLSEVTSLVTPAATCAILSCDGGTIATGHFDGQIIIWKFSQQVATGAAPILTLRGHRGPVHRMCFSPTTDLLLASAGKDGTCRVWSLASDGGGMQVFPQLRAHTLSFVYDARFSPCGKWLACCSANKTIQMFDVSRAELGLCLRGSPDSVRCVAFSPHGGILASAGDDHAIRLWEYLRRGRELGREPMRGHGAAITSIVFSHDGTLLVSASADSTVRVWDCTMRLCVSKLVVATPGTSVSEAASHFLGVTSCDFSHPQSEVLGAACTDGSLRFWSPKTGAELLVREREAQALGSAEHISFCVSSPHLALSAHLGGRVRIWHWKIGAELVSTTKFDRDVTSQDVRSEMEKAGAVFRPWSNSFSPVRAAAAEVTPIKTEDVGGADAAEDEEDEDAKRLREAEAAKKKLEEEIAHLKMKAKSVVV